jgi:hypothetical protein
MSRYSLGLTSAAATTASAGFNIKSASTDRPSIVEIGIFQPGTGTPTVVGGGFGKAANSGSVAGTNQVAQAEDAADPAVTAGLSAVWTTAPTAPTLFFRRFSIPAVLGAGIIFTFPLGLKMPISGDYCLWNNGGTTWLALNCYIVWDE